MQEIGRSGSRFIGGIKVKKWTQEQLEEKGYRIVNMIIRSANISMKKCGVAELSMSIEGSGCECVYGGYVVDHGHLRSEDFSGSDMGMESILRIMDTVGVETFNDLKGKYIRAATKGWGDSVKIIGNILGDKWFDIESFFEDKKKCTKKDERIKKIDNWIPCNENLPKEDGEYLVTFTNPSLNNERLTGVMYYFSKSKDWTAFSETVFAWMPKPEPWKGETK